MTNSNIVIAFGRLAPMTKGHQKLIEKVCTIARLLNCEHRIILTHTYNKVKNPIPIEEKLQFAHRFFPGVKFSSTTKTIPTIFNNVDKLFQEGFKHITLVAGSDRVVEFKKLFNEYQYNNIDVISAGTRTSDELSGSKMREAASKGDYETFKKGTPSHLNEKDIDDLYLSIRKGMGKFSIENSP